MEKIAREMRAVSAETLQELWRLGFPLLAPALYFISSPVLSHLYGHTGEEDPLKQKDSRFWSRAHLLLGMYGLCILIITIVSGTIGGWWFNIISPTFWKLALAFYSLGAFAFWTCTVTEPEALDRLAHELNLPKAGD